MIWQEQDKFNNIYLDPNSGRIVGRVMCGGVGSKNYYAIVNSALIGEFISLEFAKKAVENSPYLNQKNTPIPGITP
jgi:hypothetical protein